MKHLLRALAARNLLITYTVGMYTGQRLRAEKGDKFRFYHEYKVWKQTRRAA